MRYFRKVAYNSKLNAYNSIQLIMLQCNVGPTIFYDQNRLSECTFGMNYMVMILSGIYLFVNHEYLRLWGLDNFTYK